MRNQVSRLRRASIDLREVAAAVDHALQFVPLSATSPKSLKRRSPRHSALAPEQGRDPHDAGPGPDTGADGHAAHGLIAQVFTSPLDKVLPPLASASKRPPTARAQSPIRRRLRTSPISVRRHRSTSNLWRSNGSTSSARPAPTATGPEAVWAARSPAATQSTTGAASPPLPRFLVSVPRSRIRHPRRPALTRVSAPDREPR